VNPAELTSLRRRPRRIGIRESCRNETTGVDGDFWYVIWHAGDIQCARPAAAVERVACSRGVRAQVLQA
jgi:hypothetical protein